MKAISICYSFVILIVCEIVINVLLNCTGPALAVYDAITIMSWRLTSRLPEINDAGTRIYNRISDYTLRLLTVTHLILFGNFWVTAKFLHSRYYNTISLFLPTCHLMEWSNIEAELPHTQNTKLTGCEWNKNVNI